MKKITTIIVSMLILSACGNNAGNLKFKTTKKAAVWSNSLVEFRTDMDSNDKRNDLPTFQASVMLNGKKEELKQDNTALGYGASAPQGMSGLYAPPRGATSAQILSMTPEQLVVHLHYDKWNILETGVALDKQVTLYSGNPVMKVIDYYIGDFDLLNVSAGLPIGYNGSVSKIENGYSILYNNGISAIIIMPEVENMTVDKGSGNVFLKKQIMPNQPLYYYVGLSEQGTDFLLEQLAKIM
ncbi:MAG: DUF4861 family protein [Bacteroidaceae bacterium]|nr:DUF4861 family protein [Bacteroidaceae bacterium]